MLPLVALVATATPAVDVYTFGPGDDLFGHFGHSAICVASGVDDRCYNFGTADFDTPLPLTRDFIRGRAVFWVSVVRRAPMLAFYRDADRTILRQRLPLTAAAAQVLADDLATSARGEARYYRYHHYADNCTTRIRDAIDRATGGQLRAWADAQRAAPTLREHTRRHLATAPALALVGALVLGRPVDAPSTAWASMFLPDELARALESALGAVPQVEYARRAPVAPIEARPWEWAWAAIGLALALPLLLSRRRAARAPAALALAAIACAPWALAALSSFAELRHNEVLLVLWPTDALAWGLGDRAARRYAVLRAIALGAVATAWAAGALVQPLAPMLVLAGAPLVLLAALGATDASGARR